MFDDDGGSIAEYGKEIHALSSATKPLCSWISRDAIQNCRESCGGHGYLKSKCKISIVCVCVCVYNTNLL